MKKLLLASLLFTIAYTMAAQSKSQLGIRLGLNNAKILNSGLDNKPGLYTGLFLAVRFTENYTMQPEIVYSNQGGNASYRNGEDININYEPLPSPINFLLVKIRVSTLFWVLV